jgi:carbamoyl-phosphate synthase large subunit
MNILFTCAGRRNYLINYFKETLSSTGKTFAADMQLSAPSMADADEAIIVKRVDDPEYISDLIQICKDHQIDAIISLNDLELPILSKQKTKIEEKTKAKVIVPTEEVVEICFDKLKTVEFAKELGINVPATYSDLESTTEAIKASNLTLPVVVKPRWGSASIGLEFPDDEKELELAFQLINYRLDRTIISEVSKQDRDRAIMIQQKISGKEFGLDIINDLNGNHQAVIAKEKLAMRSGETDKAKTVHNPELEKIGRLIGENLGHIGNLDCDIMEENGEYYLIEMNPRFGGGYPFSHEAGSNVPKAIIHWLKGEEAPTECFEVQYEKAFSKCDRLIEVKKGYLNE